MLALSEVCAQSPVWLCLCFTVCCSGIFWIWFQLPLLLLASPLFLYTQFIIIIIKYFSLKMSVGCYLFVNVCCTLPIPACLHIPYHSPYSKLLRNSFGFCSIKITRLSEMLVETTPMIGSRCPSVKWDWLFVLLFFIRGKKLFICISAAEHYSHS